MTATTTPTTEHMPSRYGRTEAAVQVVIMLVVAGMAGAASFRHVHDWTMYNSPAGTGGWFGWANAMVSELIPLAAGLEARRRHRRYGSTGVYPVALILGAVALSLTGQFAEAKPGISGLLVSAVPALGFLALVKLVLSTPTTKPTTQPTAHAVVVPVDRLTTTQPIQSTTEQTIEPAAVPTSVVPAAADTDNPTVAAPSRVDDRPAVRAGVVAEVPTPATVAARKTTNRTPSNPATGTPVQAAGPARTRPHSPSPSTAPKLAPPATDTPVTAPAAAQLTLPVAGSELLGRAAQVARQYRTEHGTPITPGQLAVRLKVTSEQASQALAVLDLDANHPDSKPTATLPTVNGHRPQPPARATR